jgi:hypothetical protein
MDTKSSPLPEVYLNVASVVSYCRTAGSIYIIQGFWVVLASEKFHAQEDTGFKKKVSSLALFVETIFDVYTVVLYICMYACMDRLCRLVVRVPGYRFRGPGSIPGATRFSEK